MLLFLKLLPSINQLLINEIIISLKDQGLYNRKTKRYGNLRIYVALKIPQLDTEQAINEFIKRLKHD